MALHVETGELTPAPDPLQPYDPAMSPGVAPPTAIVAGQLSGPTVPAADVSYQAQVAGAEADIRAAQAAGMTAENDRRAGYAADIAPVGAAYGSQPALPVEPAYANPPQSGFLYPWQGDEPVPSDA
jgi:hypothetical protein